MKIMREEIFGPVVAVAKFKDEEEVLELANDTTYGLAAGIFTKDYERAVRVTGALKAGTVWVSILIPACCERRLINSKVGLYNFVHWSESLFRFERWFRQIMDADPALGMPFGGYKESGIGRECGDAALENYTGKRLHRYNLA